MNINAITLEEFVVAANDFIKLSNKYFDGWTLHQKDNERLGIYVRKEEFVKHQDKNEKVFLYRAEYIIFFNLSYGVPCFSFNIWDHSGKFLTLEKLRQITLLRINKEDFYKIVTQQEHPVMHRPYFIVHPCETESILQGFRYTSQNLIVTFLGIIAPLIQLNLPLEYGL